MTANKPTFLLSKGERRAREGMIDTYDVDRHYRAVYRGLLQWDNLPDGCPAGYPMDCLYTSGGVGVKRMRGIGPVLSAIRPSTLTVYGQPYQWIPEPVGMAMDLSDDYFRPTADPCMWLGASMEDMIAPYLTLLERTLKVLNTNLIGLSQPIAFKGLPGAELPALVLKSQIVDGDITVPSTGTGFNAEVLDLKAVDHTQNLISTADWCDARILEIMMSSNGVEKSSGITTLETVSGVTSIMQEADCLLERCKAFCDAANDKYKLDMSVSPGRGLKAIMQPVQEADTGGMGNAQ